MDVDPEALALLAELSVLVDKLAATDLSSLAGDSLLLFTQEWERLKRSGVRVDHAIVGELDERYLAGDLGKHNTASLLVDLLRLDPAVARQRVRDYTDFGPRHTMTGEPLPPLFPATAQALSSGEIGVEHARVVSTLFDKIPPQSVEQHDVIEAAALGAAAVCGPHRLKQWAVQAAARIDQDGPEPDDSIKQRRRGVTITDLPDGWTKVTGYLDPWAGASLRAVLGPLAAPNPAQDGTRDVRTAAQRRHDGLADACQRLLRAGGLPETGGASTTILVTVDHKDLLAGLGYAQTSYGQQLPIDELVRHAAEANVIPVFLADTGGVLAYGRSRRLASPGQRRALAARDGGCIRPGCTTPADWCEVNHIRRWEDWGPTDLDNLHLICPADHRALDHGAEVAMIDHIPHWIEPPWIDPARTPRRNTAHHMPRTFESALSARGTPGRASPRTSLDR